MLDLCALSPGDVIADLGSGDGRIPILAGSLFRVSRAVGIEGDPAFAERCREFVRTLGLDEKIIEIICGDFLEIGLSEFDVITIFQSQEIIGVVSYLLPLGGYSPLTLLKPSCLSYPFYLYRAPILRLNGPDSLDLMREISQYAEDSEKEWSRVWAEQATP